MDNNAPHGFFGGESDSYEQMMLMGGAGQQGYGGIPSWMGGAAGGFQTSVAGMQTGMPTSMGAFRHQGWNAYSNRRISDISSWRTDRISSRSTNYISFFRWRRCRQDSRYREWVL